MSAIRKCNFCLLQWRACLSLFFENFVSCSQRKKMLVIFVTREGAHIVECVQLLVADQDL